MSKIKICGLTRPCDIDFVNEAKPDFCGFILGVPKSRRNLSISTLYALRERLDASVKPVGVFVDAPMEMILPLAADGTLAAIQLHGHESEEYIRQLKEQTSVPIFRAFRVTDRESLIPALQSPADFILLDHGAGGTGKTFDWSVLEGVTRPYILAGGLGPDNLESAVSMLHPWGVDMSSGVETDGVKDREKIFRAVQIAHKYVANRKQYIHLNRFAT